MKILDFYVRVPKDSGDGWDNLDITELSDKQSKYIAKIWSEFEQETCANYFYALLNIISEAGR